MIDIQFGTDLSVPCSSRKKAAEAGEKCIGTAFWTLWKVWAQTLIMGTSAVGTARRLTTVYDTRGMVLTVTTWDDPRVGFGSVLNQVQNAYNDFGQQTHSYQAHGGSVNTSTSPKVQYGYANGSANTIRMTSMTYPSGRGLTYDYGTTNGINDASSRIASIINTSDSVNLAAYEYLGTSGFVNAASAQIERASCSERV